MKFYFLKSILLSIAISFSMYSLAQPSKVKIVHIPEVTLNNGVKMPILGFGTLYLTDSLGINSVAKAIALGYRFFDTATIYGNEEAVGDGIKMSGIDRKKLFISTKLWSTDMGYEKTKKAFNESLKKLGVDYVDMYLIHRPNGDIMGSWRAMEELYKAGKIKAIGVSNFDSTQLADLISKAEIKPAINQIEINPYFQETKLVDIIKKKGVQVESWASFAEGRNGLFTNKILVQIGKKYNKTAAQVTLRWLVQQGIVVIPRSSNPAHMKENLNIFDFKLSKDDMDKIAKLDTKKSQFPEWH